MSLSGDIKINFKNLIYSAPNFIQFLYVLKMLWWGFGGLFGVKFIIFHLNYLVEFPINLILLFLGTIGLIGILINNSKLNILFSLFNIFLFSLVTLTFLKNIEEFYSISSGGYLIDLIGAIWLNFRFQKLRSAIKFRKYQK